MEKYLVVVNKHFNIDITEKTRRFDYVFARACYYKLCRDIGGFSYSSIARSIKKNHATILHGLKELPFMIKYNSGLLKKYNSLMRKFNTDMCEQNKIGLDQLVQDYNFLLLENDALKTKIFELEELIYKLADLD